MTTSGTDFFECFGCKKVSPLLGRSPEECPLCGSTSGQVVSRETFHESMKAGALFDVAKRAKKKER